MGFLRKGILLAVLAPCVTGCSEYLERRDTLLLGAGDAVQANIVTHVIDPWSPASRRVREPVDGDRVQRAVERYRTSPGATSSGPSSASTFSQSAAAAAPAPGAATR